jgi:hypothetical protein
VAALLLAVVEPDANLDVLGIVHVNHLLFRQLLADQQTFVEFQDPYLKILSLLDQLISNARAFFNLREI